MSNKRNSQLSLNIDPYETIVFKNQSAEILSQTIREVHNLTQQGDIYPPKFPSVMFPEVASTISIHPSEKNKSPITPAEAVALKLLVDEISAIAQALSESGATEQSFINKTLNIQGEEYDAETVEGMSDFGREICDAVRARDLIIRGHSQQPDKETIDGRVNQLVLDRFQEALVSCSLKITDLVVNIAIQKACERAKSMIVAKLAKPKEPTEIDVEIKNKVKSRIRGIVKSAKLYTQLYGIAVQSGTSDTLPSQTRTVISPTNRPESESKA